MDMLAKQQLEAEYENYLQNKQEEDNG